MNNRPASWVTEEKKGSATVNSCSSRALNSFYVVPAASTGYGSVQHRFLLPFFHMTCLRRDNYNSLTTPSIPYRLHLAHHMKDQWPAHFFLPWHLILQAWMLRRKLQIPCAVSLMHTFFSRCVISPEPGSERCLCTWSVWSLNAKGKKTILSTNYTIRLSHGFPPSCHFAYILISNVTFNSYYTRHYNTNAFNIP